MQIFGLIALILVFPTVGFTIIRLHSKALYPVPATFSGIKAPLALSRSPDQRIYLISGILIQLDFALGQITFVHSFSTLRSISLCVVDALLTSQSVAGLMILLLLVQIAAAGMIGIRTWLEQHIAKREEAGIQRTAMMEAGSKIRNDSKGSIATFGFSDTHFNPLPPLDLGLSPFKPGNTKELKDVAGVKISAPFNFRIEDALDSANFALPRQISRQASGEQRENPFLSPAERKDLNERVYPKTADYQYEYTSAVNHKTDYHNAPVRYKSQRAEIRPGRPSSDFVDPTDSPLPPGLRDPQLSYMSMPGAHGPPPKTQGVTTADLYPPPSSLLMDPQRPLTAKSATSSYSRPFNEGRREM
jgi:hypothetical protein